MLTPPLKYLLLLLIKKVCIAAYHCKDNFRAGISIDGQKMICSGTTFYKRGIDTKDKIKASPVVYRTTLIIATVIFCNQIMTQKRI